jgi:hypothetical protein
MIAYQRIDSNQHDRDRSPESRPTQSTIVAVGRGKQMDFA